MHDTICIAKLAGVHEDEVKKVLHSKRKSPEKNQVTLKILQAAETLKPISALKE
ncbi:hypothetical protein [Bacillus sp. FJAT-42376]|uniref:hypothetical protein n=1 Tax=Bacillus sp. FJAT-42376 TaxID=2014076 RepID=UPI0013DDE550|nr:hypothetical protein [Bacillus sp. FJAT-42376]